MENPGALAGATGAKIHNRVSRQSAYSDAPGGARRVDKNGNWKLARWAWADAIDLDRTISLSAKALAGKLVRNLAHSETAHCAPGTDTMAHALGTSPDSIKRLLRELSEAGWLVRTEGRGRGNKAHIVFLWGNNVVPMVRSDASGAPANDLRNEAQKAQNGAEKGGADAPFYRRERPEEKGADMGRKGGTRALSYNKADLKSKKEESARLRTPVSQRPSGRPDYTAYDKATAPEKWEGVLFTIQRGGNAEAAWNEWLTGQGFPTLEQTGLRNAGGGWAVPSTLPPRQDDSDAMIERCRKWARVFNRKPMVQADA